MKSLNDTDKITVASIVGFSLLLAIVYLIPHYKNTRIMNISVFIGIASIVLFVLFTVDTFTDGKSVEETIDYEKCKGDEDCLRLEKEREQFMIITKRISMIRYIVWYISSFLLVYLVFSGMVSQYRKPLLITAFILAIVDILLTVAVIILQRYGHFHPSVYYMDAIVIIVSILCIIEAYNHLKIKF